MGINKILNKDFLYYASLGHKVSSVEPKAYANLLGFRKNLSLINQERTKESLFLVNHFIESIFLKKACSVLFVNLDEESKISTQVNALRSLQPFFITGWSSGVLTNTITKNKIDLIFLLSGKGHPFVIQEANKLNIPVIGLVDSDFNSNMITFPIWINDKSLDLHHDVSLIFSSIILKNKLIRYGFACKNFM
jgi:ribosomal protein S2